MLRLLTLTLLASGVFASNDTTVAPSTVDPNATATAVVSSTNGPSANATSQQSAAVASSTQPPSSNNNVASATTQPPSAAAGNSTALAADAAEIASNSVSADTEVTVEVACTTCADGCAAASMVWCKGAFDAVDTLIHEAATGAMLTLGKCDKDGKLLSGDYCSQSAKCGISANMAANLKCHVHNPNFGDVFACDVEASADACTTKQATVDTANKVTARRLVARRNLSSLSAVYTSKATLRAKKTAVMAGTLKTAVDNKVSSLTDADMTTKVATAAAAYATTLTQADLPDGTTLAVADLKTATANANITAKKPVVTAVAGSTAGATSAAISAAAVAAALLF